jgi:hypothetical protein
VVAYTSFDHVLVHEYHELLMSEEEEGEREEVLVMLV